METLCTFEQIPCICGEIWAKVAGPHMQAISGRTFFGLLCCEAVFWPCKVIARILQSAQASVSGVCKCIHMLKEHLNTLREERAVEDILAKTKAYASANNFKLPKYCRKIRTRSNFCSVTAVEEVVSEKV